MESNSRWTSAAVAVGAAALLGGAWLAREQLAWAARMVWDGDLEGRQRAAAKRDALWHVELLLARAKDLRSEVLAPLEETSKDNRTQEAFQLRVNGAETRLLEVLYEFDAVRGDEDIVKARKEAVRWINAECMDKIDALRATNK
ncbi:Hypothetical Protein FCC1311_111142 [Hondaea fermentalgiana]|uniref:Uncharacterized protein n=1 Tax=Hondaea fermentalgiana TaxID=2315210 RepID=A0A2R5H230_9STRA|nr:Hypothetical Protein FCC1311_111142 [Hondaea fermentalgiana]|eukprot:GBG34891.1 Hypothetical Protein FCC1311_111142 [Hondaea fermentalgiana]